MLWVYDHYTYFNFYSAGIDFRRQNLTYIRQRVLYSPPPPWLWKGVSATLQSGRYILSYPRVSYWRKILTFKVDPCAERVNSLNPYSNPPFNPHWSVWQTVVLHVCSNDADTNIKNYIQLRNIGSYISSFDIGAWNNMIYLLCYLGNAF